MQYPDLTTALGELMVVQITAPASATPSNDTNFNNILPNIINDAEQRIYRELDFLATRNNAWVPNALINQKYMKLPSTTIVMQGANIMTGINPIETHNIATPNLLSYTAGSNQAVLTDASAPTAGLVAGDIVDIINAGETAADLIIQGPYPIFQVSPSLIITLPFNAFVNSTTTFKITYISNFSNILTMSNIQGKFQGWPVGGLWNVGLPVTFTAAGYVLPVGSYPIVAASATARTLSIQVPVIINSNEVGTDIGNNLQVQYLKNGMGGTRNRIEIVAKDVLDILWPTDLSEQGVPRYGAFIDNQTLQLAPVPDQNYIVEFTGTFRPIPMSSGNQTTYLGTSYPDLFLAACMVFGMAYQKDADLPANAPPGQDVTKWENMYQARKTSAMSEAQRQKSQGPNWSQYSPTPESNPSRP